MGIEKDTTFKFIGKNYLKTLFVLANLPDTLDADEIEEVTEEMISLKIAQYRPDFIGKADEVVVMFEYESSFVGISSKKRFHAYVALWDYEKNDENLDIIFCVISTKERTRVVEHKIGDTDSFKILIFNINDLGFEKIISNASYKLKKQEVFSVEELVELALTSLMPGTHDGNVKQFYELSEMMEGIIFENLEAKRSFAGILLLLSNIYFEYDDPVRKKIQGVFMGKVDCIVEMCEEQFNAGMMHVARNLLALGCSIDIVSKGAELPVEKVMELKKEVESSK